MIRNRTRRRGPIDTAASIRSAKRAASRRARLSAISRFGLGCLILAAILAFPSRPSQIPVMDPAAVPLEFLGAAALLLVLRGRAFGIVLALVSACAGLLLFLKLADLGTISAFGRPFNPLLDLVILTDGWTLLTGTIGLPEALGIIALALFAWGGILALLAFCLLGARDIEGRRRLRIARPAAALAMFGTALLAAIGPGSSLPVSAANLAYLGERIALMRQSSADIVAFEAELKTDPIADLSRRPDLLSALEGHDVYVVFVESYGRTVLDDPAYRTRIAPRLASIDDAIGKAGFAARSGWLTSPTVGGQSWLAHGALLSGLPVLDQNRYDRMIASDRESLNSLFRRAGWTTLAAMPAITMDWPEGGYFGYDRVYASNDLGYEGKPFNWVTMPDQFTLAAAHRLVEKADRPVMAEIALISSHAPWTPIPHLVPWKDVGDGRVFDDQAEAGDPPAFVWAEPERIRDHFVRSVDYAMETVGSFIETHGDDAVFIVLGDHQPARLLTGAKAGREVPVHVIANDPEILGRLSALGLEPGMIPPDESAAKPMWSFREDFVRAMSGKVPPNDETASNRPAVN